MAAGYHVIDVRPRDGGFGAEVRGCSLASGLEPLQVHEVRRAWTEHSVLSFPDQPLDHAELERFTEAIGPYGDDPYLGALPDHPRIVAVERAADERSFVFGAAWHSDWSFQARPPSATILHAKVIPPVGGDTLYVDAAAAFDALAPRMKERLRGLRAIHSAASAYGPNGVLRGDPNPRTMDIRVSKEAESREVHPLLRRHPESGRTSLFVNPVYTVAVEGMAAEESQELLGELYLHLVKDAFVYRHQWKANMLVMWDNRCTMHQAEAGYEGHRRLLHRTVVCGESPLAA